MARSEVITVGGILLFIATMAYFWSVPNVGYTIPQASGLCSSDLMQWALLWGNDVGARESCNQIHLMAAAIYGTGLIGVILIIVGAVVSRKSENS